jgi:predicted RecA/RadA family phage recombinase
MSTKYVSEGATIDYANGTGSDIAADDVVKVSGVLGVALADIPDGESGSVRIKGIFRLPKVSAAVIAQGETLVWDVSAGAFDDANATPATGDVSGSTAIAAAAAGNGDTVVDVLLTGVPGTVA